jgi:hypothetical protein
MNPSRAGAGATATPRHDPLRAYGRYAAVFLAVTLLSGVWLRAVFVVPEAIGGFRFGFALHAHSHVALFGWTSMALFAVIAGRAARRPGSSGLLAHAHMVGIASAAAFVGFLLSGYSASTIAISVLHVVFWIAFVFAIWPWLDDLAPVERRYWRGALAFLVVAGLGAMTPGIVMARGIADPWIGQLSIKSFLTPFTSGWLILGAMGACYMAIPRRRFGVPAFWLLTAGVIPSTLLHTSAAPPAEWMTLAGRAGTGLVGISALLFAADLLTGRAAPLLRLVGAVAAAKGLAEVLVAAGPALELVASRQLTVAYLHLVLLGLVTPALLHAAYGIERAPRRTAMYAAGLALMVGALGAIGWPALAMALAPVGVDAMLLFRLALVGGALAAAAGIALLVPGAWRGREPSAPAMRPEAAVAAEPAAAV